MKLFGWIFMVLCMIVVGICIWYFGLTMVVEAIECAVDTIINIFRGWR